jgi:hypothetical protein
MKTNIKKTCIVGSMLAGIAISAHADFTGYWEIGGIANPAPPPPSLSTFSIPSGSSVPLAGGIGDPSAPFWTFAASGAGVGAEFQRSPTAQGVPANGFTFTADPDVDASFTIDRPLLGDPSALGYLFNYSIDTRNTGGTVQAYWLDASGVQNFIVNGTDGLFAVPGNLFEAFGAGANPEVGFYLINGSDRAISLQIQGWEPVPEPSSIAMGVLTLVGIGGFIYRRRQGAKA